MATCVICQSAGVGEQNLGGPTGFQCARCGQFVILTRNGSPFADSVRYVLEAPGADATLRRSQLSHIVRRRQDKKSYVGVRVEDLSAWGLDDPLPFPAAQFDNFILWIGHNQPNYAESIKIRAPELAGWMGAPISVEPGQILGWILSQRGADEFVEQRMDALRLTLKGWERFQALKQITTDSRMAFMAMKFGEPQLNDVVETCFKVASAAAGFELRTIAEGQPAGLIDDQIRVAIRRSKFVIADLTHSNNGAYWEAGFAEGAGKPVIYTCDTTAWVNQRTHFDTNHMATIIWDPDDLPDAERRLKAMIQATFPAEAKLD